SGCHVRSARTTSTNSGVTTTASKQLSRRFGGALRRRCQAPVEAVFHLHSRRYAGSFTRRSHQVSCVWGKEDEHPREIGFIDRSEEKGGRPMKSRLLIIFFSRLLQYLHRARPRQIALR